MIEKRHHHASVSMGNKMFVIGGIYSSTFELFDRYSRKYTYIESINLPTKYESYYEAVCTGQTIVAFSMNQTKPYGTTIVIYDVSKNLWSEKECGV